MMGEPVADETWAPVAEAARGALALLGWPIEPACLPGEPDACGASFALHAMAHFATLKAIADHQLTYINGCRISSLTGIGVLRMDELNSRSGAFMVGEDGRETDPAAPGPGPGIDPDEEEDISEADPPPETGPFVRRIWVQAFGRYNKVHYDYGLPPAVSRFLLPNELPRTIAMHKHVIVLARPFAAVAAGLPLALVLSVLALINGGHSTTLMLRFIWLPYLGLVLWYAARAAEWYCEWFVVTPERMILIRGLIARTVQPLPLKRVRDIELHQTRTGRALNYGTLFTQSLATDRQLAKIERIPDAPRVFNLIWQLLMPPGD